MCVLHMQLSIQCQPSSQTMICHDSYQTKDQWDEQLTCQGEKVLSIKCKNKEICDIKIKI